MLRHMLKVLKTETQADTCTPALFTLAKTWKESTCPLINE